MLACGFVGSNNQFASVLRPYGKIMFGHARNPNLRLELRANNPKLNPKKYNNSHAINTIISLMLNAKSYLASIS